QTETEATGAPQKHHYTLNQQVGSITHILWQETPIAMGRIVGDGAINFDIVDVAVDPAHQGKGLGRLVMEKLVAWLDANAFDGAYVTLVADVPELYAKFGFESVRPESEGMARVWRTRSR
ncbi:GNAT family N-acetyltransferase, partial [Klebsiella pneumoniae]|uniref:GNAT family N-acetyltransferase n=1 Tax=Klebsiella pneumoniae TaxID=573 RepID=UPI0021618397